MSPPADPCPICRKPADAKLAPFCSKRCADIDLGRWLKGGYAIPGPPVDSGSGGHETDDKDDPEGA